MMNSLNIRISKRFVVASILVFLTFFNVNGQENNFYGNLWKEIEELKSNGLTKSAIDKTTVLIQKAKKDGQDAQYIKGQFYRMYFRGLKEEDAILKSLEEMEVEIKNSEGSKNAILHSATAEMYWWYYSSLRWNLASRIPSDDDLSSDIREWDSKQFVDVIHEHYQASLRNEQVLKETAAGDFELIWLTGKEGRIISPTLYDVLIRRAIDFYSNNLSGLTIARDQLLIDDKKFFVSASEFVELDIQSTEFTSFDKISLQLYQSILAFHTKKKQVDALAFYDMTRLEFLYSKYQFSDRDSLYKNALIQAYSIYKTSDVSAEIGYLIAQHHHRLSNRYHYKNAPEFRWYNQSAIQWCERIIKEIPKSRGAAMCKNLIEGIVQSSFSIDIENVNYPYNPIDYVVEYKNTSKVYFRLYDNSKNILAKNVERGNEKDINYFLEKKPIQSWEKNLPDSLDYQSHSMEFDMSKLKTGYYALLTSENPEFKTSDNLLNLNFFWVSDLAYLVHQDRNGRANILVTNRQNGKPLKGVMGKFYNEVYNAQSRRTDLIEAGEGFSDASGEISNPNIDEQRNFRVLLVKGNDSLMMSNPIYYRKLSSENSRSTFSTSIFTDRAIYRPGQTIYFKGLVLEKKSTQEVELVKDREVTIKLMDVNSNEVARMNVKTSKFGTYNGTFFLPTSALMGRFFLDDGISRQAIFIEEYKRPNFLVELEEIKKNIRIGEEITMRGVAKSFNDIPLNNVKGSFNVQRVVSMGIPYHGFTYLPNQMAEIAFGDFVTDENGKFEFTFKALPDKAVPKENRPIFQFTADVIVSDLNGESQQAEKSIPIGYHSLNLNMDIANQVDKSSLDSARILTQNLSGFFTSAKVKMKITSLKASEQTIVEKLWDTPDYSVSPHKNQVKTILYKDDKLMDLWPLDKEVFSKNFLTEENKQVSLKELSKLPSGPYEIILESKDPFGQEVVWSKRITLFNPADKKNPIPTAFWSSLQTKSCYVGEDAVILIGSNNENASMFYTVSNKDSVFVKEWLTFNKGMKEIRIPVKEKDRGGLLIQTAMVANGRSYMESYYVQVPFDNKELDVRLKTIRDKVRPGDTETWTLDILNKEGKELNAEVLVSMYDASLDKIRPFNWRFQPYNYSIPRVYWYDGNNFSSSRSRLFSFKQIEDNFVKPRTFDQLNWFGFTYYGGMRYYASHLGGEPEMDGIMIEKSASLQTKSNVLDVEEGAVTDNVEEENENIESLREDFRETAFFYPELISNETGKVEFTFEVPDALTKWKMQVVAHTEDLKYGLITNEVSSVKELMLVPNYPRFLLTGDTLIFSSKISNLTSEEINVDAKIQVSNAIDNQPITESVLSETHKKVKLAGNSNGHVQWKLIAPKEAGIINIAVHAKSEKHFDGEVRPIPILTKEKLITETYPISLRGQTNKTIHIDKISENQVKTGIKPKSLTLEFTSNPAWYVVQALPYIAKINNESSDQLFNRYFANSIGQFIMNSNERIQEVIELWSRLSPDAFLSALEKNEELKQMVLSETPWLLEAKGESENKREIVLFFDKNNLNNSLNTTLYELMQLQSPNGGWPWFKGMPDNRFITQHIVLGLARMNNMGVISINQNDKLRNSMASAVNYLDQRVDEEYRQIIIRAKKPEDNHLSALHCQYLFMRSYYSDVPMVEKHREALDYFKDQCEKFWLQQSNYTKAMIALTFNRNGNPELSNKIIASLRENALHSDEFGMYWNNETGHYWYNSSVESQSMLIEAFTELVNDEAEIEELKINLLKQKQTKMWRTGRASVEACSALLLKGSDNLLEGNTISMRVGDESFEISPKMNAEAGSGYFKNSWNEKEIEPKMSEVFVENKGKSISWGAVYFQFFQDVDKVERFKAGLSIERDYYLKKYTNGGVVLNKLSKDVRLEIGDVVVVKLVIKLDRDLEFIHLKDMRAAGLEPIQNNSGYQYDGSLGYYLSIKDASTNFFFNQLNKGSYTLQYELKVNNSGAFSSGIATIQSFYNPEFSSHSKGGKIEIK